MTDFADVEQFGHQHASHGGLTPSATPQPGGGFVLRLTCACGESFDRREGKEEVLQFDDLDQTIRRFGGA